MEQRSSAEALVSTPLEFNPFDASFRADPYPVYQRLREEDPARLTAFGMVALSRYSDCVKVLKHPSASSDSRNSTAYQQQLARGDNSGSVFGEVAGVRPFLFMDPPDHTRLRGMVQKAFTTKMVNSLRSDIREAIVEILAPAVRRGSMEVIKDLAYPLPIQVVSRLLGVPSGDYELFKEWAQEFARAHDPAGSLSHLELERRERAASSFLEYFRRVIYERRKRPADDLVSHLIAVEDEGNRLTEEELLSTLILLLVAGHETTVNLIGNGFLALSKNPAQFGRLSRNPELARSAVDEILRYDAPVQLTARVMLDEVVVADRIIARGDQVLVLLASANRDAAQFDEPDVFDIERQNNRHLSFSLGSHFCLGAMLARAEGEILFTELATRIDELVLDEDTLRYKDYFVLRGLDVLPVTFKSSR